MRGLYIYADASVVGGCEDEEFRDDSLALWQRFKNGEHTLVLSSHTLRELMSAPEAVRQHLRDVPQEYQILLQDTDEAFALAEAYIQRGIIGPGARSDALHVALAMIGRVDIIVSWNFKHIVNLHRIRLFNSVNLEKGYGLIEIRTPSEVLEYEPEI